MTVDEFLKRKKQETRKIKPVNLTQKFYTPRELSERLKVSRITIIRMINRGELQAIKVGNQWRIPANCI